ncbi:hypothetical protein TcCL_NonESM07085 [Trypanosoma cruzi]|nr:hypothetical protein TcCL_NonESM07085 [Trypanosoma cruzi]
MARRHKLHSCRLGTSRCGPRDVAENFRAKTLRLTPNSYSSPFTMPPIRCAGPTVRPPRSSRCPRHGVCKIKPLSGHAAEPLFHFRKIDGCLMDSILHTHLSAKTCISRQTSCKKLEMQ